MSGLGSYRSGGQSDINCSDDELSPTEYLAKQYFPLSDYELIKIYDYHIKIYDDLKIIHGDVQVKKRPLEPDDSEDGLKMTRRKKEFATRFSRNHLYPLRSEIRQVIIAVKASKKRRDQSQVLRNKMTQVYKTALEAVQTYISYSNQPKNLKVYDKLKELLVAIKDLHGACEGILIPIEKSVGNGCLALLPSVCEDILEVIERPPPAIPPVIPAVLLPKPARKKKTAKNLNSTTSCLSMYEPKLGHWAMKSQALARLKFAHKVAARNKQMSSNSATTKQTQRVTENMKVSQNGPTSSRSPSMAAMGKKPKPERRIDFVPTEPDIETQIQWDQQLSRSEGNTYRKATPRSASSSSTSEHGRPDMEMRLMLQEALKDLETGQKDKAFEKLQQITSRDKVVSSEDCRAQIPSRCEHKTPRNVGVFHVISETAIKEPDHSPVLHTKVTSSSYRVDYHETQSSVENSLMEFERTERNIQDGIQRQNKKQSEEKAVKIKGNSLPAESESQHKYMNHTRTEEDLEIARIRQTGNSARDVQNDLARRIRTEVDGLVGKKLINSEAGEAADVPSQKKVKEKRKKTKRSATRVFMKATSDESETDDSLELSRENIAKRNDDLTKKERVIKSVRSESGIRDSFRQKGVKSVRSEQLVSQQMAAVENIDECQIVKGRMQKPERSDEDIHNELKRQIKSQEKVARRQVISGSMKSLETDQQIFDELQKQLKIGDKSRVVCDSGTHKTKPHENKRKGKENKLRKCSSSWAELVERLPEDVIEQYMTEIINEMMTEQEIENMIRSEFI